MSAQPLLSTDSAGAATFADLARNIRENLDEARVKPNYRIDDKALSDLLHILKAKVDIGLLNRPPRPEEPPGPTMGPGKRGFRQYQREFNIYRAQLAKFRREQAVWDKRYGTNNPEARENALRRMRIVEHLQQDVDAYRKGEYRVPIKKLSWRFLPPGPNGVERLIVELTQLRRRYPHLLIDEERVRYAYSLRPSNVYIGQDEFDGYFAFLFDRTDHVLLENPLEGNAAYIFKENWASLSKLSKFELLTRFPDCVERVLHRHSGSWKWRIKDRLRLR